MRNQKMLKIGFFLVLFSSVLWFRCCSTIGYFVGGAFNSKKKMVPTECWDIKIGTPIEIQLSNGNWMLGAFKGFGVIPQEEYEKNIIYIKICDWRIKLRLSWEIIFWFI